MDSKMQVKKTSVTEGTRCRQPGNKKAKERKSSRLNVFIYSAGDKIFKLPQAGSQLRRVRHDEYRQHGGPSRSPNLLIRFRYNRTSAITDVCNHLRIKTHNY
ncbi:hypothetical protein AVEN_217336-1 [Araneus ventricosus]|uniref:Uncharacterized protein n=1 Tax=Araneus ventricosus TaxID=182803 RepID=A0A4Y2JTQ7_ARAVE|nr:hypothetical protein AVEN_217336-1 [Araneus ventricosus]